MRKPNMKQVSRNIFRRIFAFVLVTIFVVVAASAQVGQAVHFSVPYAFVAGSQTLPAGNYTFSLSQKESFRLMVKSEKSDPFGVTIVSALNGPNELFRGGYL